MSNDDEADPGNQGQEEEIAAADDQSLALSDENVGVEALQDELGAVNLKAAMDARYEVQTGRYDLQPRRPREYGHLHAHLESTAMTQYSVRQGLK